MSAAKHRLDSLPIEPSGDLRLTFGDGDSGDVGVTETLAPEVPNGVAVLSESALLTPEDVGRAFAAGAHGVLIGTAVLQAADPAAAVAELAAVIGS